MKHYEKVICIGIIGYFIVSLLCGACLQNRLEQARRELESTRMELAEARNRQSELESTITQCRDIVRRDGELLSESFTTIAGIRSQIQCIRENYEEMENILSGNNNSGDNVPGD